MNILDSVNISYLDDIQKAENFDYYVNYEDDTDPPRIAMVQNLDVVLWRTIMDWSRQDGNVVSHQIIWSGSFADCERVVGLFDTPSSVQFRIEDFDLHPQLSAQFISLHQTHPIAASLSAIYSAPTVIISEELLDTGDDEGFLCAICHDRIPTGFPTKQLPCKHIFHSQCECIAEWFYIQVTCPLCRNAYQ